MPVSNYKGRIIDVHNHPDWHGHNLDRFIANMDEHGIARTWLLTWICPRDEWDPAFAGAVPFGALGSEEGPIPFERCLSYIERAPERFILGYAPDPRKPGALQKMQAAIEIYGVRICGEVKLRMMYDNPDAIELFRFCGDKNVPVTVHIDYPIEIEGKHPRPNYWYGGGIEAFERTLQQCPGTIFLGHAPGFWAHISGDDQYGKEYYPKGKVQPNGKMPELMRKYPNLFGDLSAGSAYNALERDPENGREFILEFEHRLLYARDDFGNDLQDLLDSFDLPESVLENILINNAALLIP